MHSIPVSPGRLVARLWNRLRRSWRHFLSLEFPFHAAFLETPAAGRKKVSLTVEPLEDRQLLSAVVLGAVVPTPVIDPVVATATALALGDQYTVAQDHTLVIIANQKPYGLLYNDLAGNGGALRIVGHTQPQFGSLTLGADGSFTYFPRPGFAGVDHFTYTIDTSPAPLTATVLLTVTATPATIAGPRPAFGAPGNSAVPLAPAFSALQPPAAGLNVAGRDALFRFPISAPGSGFESGSTAAGSTTAVSTKEDDIHYRDGSDSEINGWEIWGDGESDAGSGNDSIVGVFGENGAGGSRSAKASLPAAADAAWLSTLLPGTPLPEGAGAAPVRDP